MRTCRILIIQLLLLLGAAWSPSLRAQLTESYTFTPNLLVPDGNVAGLTDVHGVSSGLAVITALNVRLKIAGEYNGDVYAYLRHASGYTVLLNRPGKTTNNPEGYPDSGFDVTFQDGSTNGDVHLYQAIIVPTPGSPLTGVWQPDGRTNDPALVTDDAPRVTALTNFTGLAPSGGWTLFVADLKSGGTNQLAQWGLDITGLAYPKLTWPNPAAIPYGALLSATQLNATATYNSTNVPGVFTYSPTVGTLLSAGSNQVLSVTFTPTDTAAFLPTSTNVTINVNPPPAAAVRTVTRTAGLALLIAWSNVATNWSDASGATVRLAGFNPVTTNGVTLATNAAWILYPDAPELNDQFSYGISDGVGGTNIGYVNIVMKTSVTGTNSITRITVGNPTVLTALGIPGYTYLTERSTNLPPTWVDISTNQAATNGVLTILDYFSDLGSNQPASSFYQLKWRP